MNIEQKLSWLIQMGVTSFCAEAPSHTNNTLKKTPSIDAPATTQAVTQASNISDLSTLNAQKQAFDLSALKKTATHTLLGQGVHNPKLMCIFEMPSTDSDRSGQVLSGPQGELFTKMMQAIHLDIATDVYVAYLSPWRTPGNRTLTETEQAMFLPFLAREIELVSPQKILLFGASVAQALLKTENLSKARGKWHQFNNVPVRVTLALSSVKTTPLRRQAWVDLQELEK